MNYLITTASSIQLTNAEGTTKTISKNQLWYKINKETITFLVLADAQPEGDGTCFFTSRISDLNVNGEVYDKDTIVKALDDIFEPVDIADVYTKRQIDEMLEEYAQVDDLNDFIMVKELPDYLADYQKKLVSGTNIKTVNGQSLLGEGNIVIEGGGGGSSITVDSALSSTSENPVQNKVVKGALDAKADKTEIPDMAGYPTTNQMNTAINSAVAGKADANSVPTKTSQLTNDSGFLTSHQSLDGLFDSVEYDSSAKRINFKDKTNTVVGYVDASDFVKDGMVEDVRIENGRLVIDFNTDSGITDISIPLTDIFNADNYYTKTEIDSKVDEMTSGMYSTFYTKTEVNAELAKKADTDNLATVATSGSYNDLSDKPIIPEGAVIDSALSDTSNNAVANRIVKGALDAKADKTEIPDMTEYYTSKEVDGMIEGFVTQKEVDDITADFASIKDVDAAVDGAKPYLYQFNESSIETFDEAKTALVDNGRGLLLRDKPGYYHSSSWQYDETGAPKFTFVHFREEDGTAIKITAQKATESRSPGYNTVKWTTETLTEDEIFNYRFENTDVELFDKAVEAYNSGKTIIVESKGNCPASSFYDYIENVLSLSWIDAEGNIVAYKVQKTGDGKKNPYKIEWTDVTPKPASITVDTEITEKSQNPVTSAAIYQMVGNVEEALKQINGTANE